MHEPWHDTSHDYLKPSLEIFLDSSLCTPHARWQPNSQALHFLSNIFFTIFFFSSSSFDLSGFQHYLIYSPLLQRESRTYPDTATTSHTLPRISSYLRLAFWIW